MNCREEAGKEEQTVSEQFAIGGLEIGIIVGYLILSRIIPLILNPKSDTSEGYFLGSRNMAWPLIGLSVWVTNMSGALPVGLAGAGYNQGISVYSYEWMAGLTMVVFVFFILPFYLESKVYTMPEFLERRYDVRSRKALSVFTLLSHVFIDMALGLYAGGLVISLIFPDLPLWIIIVGLMILSIVYTVMGGLGAVMISDAIQACVVIIGGAIVFFAALQAVGSWDAVAQAAPEGHLHIFQPTSSETLPWPGLLTGLVLLNFYFFTTNQYMVQRTLGARSTDHGRWGAIFAGFLKLPVLFILILPGTMAIALYPNLETPDLAYPTLVFDLLPAGLRAFVLAALVAAITSTVDSILNSVSTLVTMDFVQAARPDLDDHNLVRIGRITVVVSAIIVCVWAPQITNFPSLWAYLQSTLSYTAPPIVAVFFLGIGWRRVTSDAAFWTLVTMIPLGIFFFILVEVMGVFSLFFLYAAAVSFVVSLMLLAIISLFTPAPDYEKIEHVTWSSEVWHRETRRLKDVPWYKNYRFWSVALILSTAIVVFIFR